MGFAVVADEVRNLAGRCSQAAKDTSEMIERSISTSSDGKQKLERLAELVRAIVQSSSEVKTLVDEVHVASEEQSRGMDQIAAAITQMDQVTQRTAANAEEGASASEELSGQARSLQEEANALENMVKSKAS